MACTHRLAISERDLVGIAAWATNMGTVEQGDLREHVEMGFALYDALVPPMRDRRLREHMAREDFLRYLGEKAVDTMPYDMRRSMGF